MRPSYVASAYDSRNITTATAATTITDVIASDVTGAIMLGVDLVADAVAAARIHVGIAPCSRLETSSTGMSSGPMDLDLLKH